MESGLDALTGPLPQGEYVLIRIKQWLPHTLMQKWAISLT